MKRLTLILCVLTLCSMASATVPVLVGSMTVATTTSTPITFTCSGSVTCTATDTVVLLIPVTAKGTYEYCQDNNLNTIFPGPQNSTTALTFSSFQGVLAAGVTEIVCRGTWTNNMKGILAEFSGVLSVNISLAGNSVTGSGTSLSMPITTEDNDDLVVCGFSQAANVTYSSLSGTAVTSVSGGPSATMFTVTSSTPATVPCSATSSFSSTSLGLAIELRPVSGATPLYSLLQIAPSGYNPNTGSTFGCPRGVGTNDALYCTFAIPAIPSGATLVVVFSDDLDNGIGAGAHVLLADIRDCTTLTGGVCATSINSWTIDTRCTAFAYISTLYQENVGGAYVLSSVAGGTNMTAKRSSNTAGEPWSVTLYVVQSPYPITIDDIESASNSTGTNTYTMTGTTPTGSDLIFQVFSSNPNSIVSSPYLTTISYTHSMSAYAITSNGSAPTWVGNNNEPAAGCAFALHSSVVIPPWTPAPFFADKWRFVIEGDGANELFGEQNLISDIPWGTQ